jgi:transcriptional regulator with XRE-family HTH domain
MNDYLLKNKKLLGKNLRILRLSKDCSLEELARVLPISISQMSLIENGKRSIRLYDLKKLLNHLDTTIGYFFSKSYDSIENYNFNPDFILQNKSQAILIDEDNDKYQLKLLRPVIEKNEIEILELFIKGGYMTEKIKFDINIRGIIQKNEITINSDNQNVIAFKGEDILLNNNIKYRFFNHTERDTIINLIVSPALF